MTDPADELTSCPSLPDRRHFPAEIAGNCLPARTVLPTEMPPTHAGVRTSPFALSASANDILPLNWENVVIPTTSVGHRHNSLTTGYAGPVGATSHAKYPDFPPIGPEWERPMCVIDGRGLSPRSSYARLRSGRGPAGHAGPRDCAGQRARARGPISPATPNRAPPQMAWRIDRGRPAR